MRKNTNEFPNQYFLSLSYIRDLYAKEDILLKNVRHQSLMYDRPITINSEEGRILQFLIKSCNINHIIEIGTLYGYSTIWLARALNKQGRIITIDHEKENLYIARQNFNLLENNIGNQIETLLGDAQKKMEELISLNSQYDMIFIDADKINYLNYLKLSEKLIKKNGLIVADNTFLSGASYLNYLPNRISFSAQKNIREFNKELSNTNKYDCIVLNTSEGFTIARKLF